MAVVIAGGKLGKDPGHLLLAGNLAGQIQGHFYIISGNGSRIVPGIDDGAVGGEFIVAPAIDAVEIFFKGQFKATLTNLRVHQVVGDIRYLVHCLIVFPLLGAHGTYVAQHMGGIFGVIFPNGGGLHHHAGTVEFGNSGKVLVADVRQENIVGQSGAAEGSQAQFVPQPQNSAGILIGPFRRDSVAVPQFPE